MRTLGWVSVVALGVVATARAQDGKIREIPLPPEEPPVGEPPPPAEEPLLDEEEEVEDDATAPPEGGRRRAEGPRPRRERRAAVGEPPTQLAGVWSVVQRTERGETEDYRLQMERAGKALDEDCFVTATWFDFGPPGGGSLPDTITVTQVHQCTKGGLGTYASETSVTTAAVWTHGASTSLALPEVRADHQLVRLRRGGEGGRTPSNWVGPQVRVERPPGTYSVLAEYPARRADGDRPIAVHLTDADGAVWHLERLQAFE